MSTLFKQLTKRIPYAVSVAYRDGEYMPMVHYWVGHRRYSTPGREYARNAGLLAFGKADEFADRLRVPHCMDDADLIEAIVASIPDKLRAVIVADAATGMTKADIGERYGLSQKTIVAVIRDSRE